MCFFLPRLELIVFPYEVIQLLESLDLLLGQGVHALPGVVDVGPALPLDQILGLPLVLLQVEALRRVSVFLHSVHSGSGSRGWTYNQTRDAFWGTDLECTLLTWNHLWGLKERLITYVVGTVCIVWRCVSNNNNNKTHNYFFIGHILKWVHTGVIIIWTNEWWRIKQLGTRRRCASNNTHTHVHAHAHARLFSFA